ncbi:MAG: metallophosphoesterase [Eubacteriales bacterium]|nr:metallophosphoesterase [Eubacteriales bacterium]
MKVMVISDTHGKDEELQMAIQLEKPFDHLIHCGDVEGQEAYVQSLAGCPCTIVAGNNDFFSELKREEQIILMGHNILVSHGHLYGVSMDLAWLRDEARSRECDLAFFGHTHKPVAECRDGLWVVNPGSLSYPRQIGKLPSYAVVEFSEDGNVTAEIRYLKERIL